jgi:hypothetical protein
MSNAPIIDTVGTPTSDTIAPLPEAPAPPPVPPVVKSAPPPVQQLTVADVVARIHKVLMEDYEMAGEEINRIEQLGQIQVGDITWVTGKTAPGNDTFHVLVMYQGDGNERIAGYTQGDIRAYLIPRTVVTPGAREYRRYTFNALLNKTSTHRMTLDAFVEAVAYEELTVAEENGIVAPDDDEDEEEVAS